MVTESSRERLVQVAARACVAEFGGEARLE